MSGQGCERGRIIQTVAGTVFGDGRDCFRMFGFIWILSFSHFLCLLSSSKREADSRPRQWDCYNQPPSFTDLPGKRSICFGRCFRRKLKVSTAADWAAVGVGASPLSQWNRLCRNTKQFKMICFIQEVERQVKIGDGRDTDLLHKFVIVNIKANQLLTQLIGLLQD